MRTEMGEDNTFQKYTASYRTIDMLDFSKAKFDKAIRTSIDKKIIIHSKYPLVKLGAIAEVLKGRSITKAEATEGDIKVVAGGTDYAYMHNVANRPANTITISASGANAGFVNFWKEPIFASDCTTVRGRNDLETLFLYNFLQSIQDQIFYLQKGSAQPHVYPDDIADLQIPQIEEDKMRQFVTECQKIETECNTSHIAIEDSHKKIEQVFEELLQAPEDSYAKMVQLGELCEINSGGTPSKKIQSYWENGTIPWLKSEVCKGDFVYSTNEFITEDGYKNSSAKLFPVGTTLIALVGATKGKTAFLKFEASTNQNIAGSRFSGRRSPR